MRGLSFRFPCFHPSLYFEEPACVHLHLISPVSENKYIHEKRKGHVAEGEVRLDVVAPRWAVPLRIPVSLRAMQLSDVRLSSSMLCLLQLLRCHCSSHRLLIWQCHDSNWIANIQSYSHCNKVGIGDDKDAFCSLHISESRGWFTEGDSQLVKREWVEVISKRGKHTILWVQAGQDIVAKHFLVGRSTCG